MLSSVDLIYKACCEILLYTISFLISLDAFLNVIVFLERLPVIDEQCEQLLKKVFYNLLMWANVDLTTIACMLLLWG